MKGRKLKLFLLFVCIIATINLSGQKVNRWYFNVDKSSVAIGGYDVVSYYTQDKPTLGKEDFIIKYEGIIYQFSSKENRSLFQKNPERYLPAFGGWCTFLMGIDKQFFPPTRSRPDPENFKVINDKLYLFGKSARQNLKEAFEKNDSNAILKRADAFWASREKLAAKSDGLPKDMNPHARMELLEWMPFIGDWQCKLSWWADTTGQTKLNYTGKWQFRFGYQGYCIQDDYIGDEDNNFSGTPYGPAIRGYDPSNEKWHMTYIPVNQARGQTWIMEGNFIKEGVIEGTMELKDPSGNPVLQKVRLEAISEDQFIWSGDWSYDGGETWLKNVGYSVCTRIK